MAVYFVVSASFLTSTNRFVVKFSELNPRKGDCGVKVIIVVLRWTRNVAATRKYLEVVLAWSI